MNIKGQLALDRIDCLPASHQELLRSLWIESVEEYLGLLAALESVPSGNETLASVAGSDRSRGLAKSLLGAVAAAALERGRPGGSLGFELTEEIREAFRTSRRLGAVRVSPPLGLGSEPLPTQVRLLDRLGAVRNQGSRGTCVAFSAVALREFLDSAGSRFSEQFLYWACKELDGRPHSGTSLHTAMGAMSQYGCCLFASWPYNDLPDPANEAQGPPPDAALAEARGHRMVDCRPVEPNLVRHHQRVLAGSAGAEPMPVVAGFLVFDSWFMSPAVHRTGKITLPLPGEEPVGGHAVCLVGYQDDPSVPGGGYFIARNSWGVGWAPDSPESAGHAMIPYAYIESGCIEAFTGPAGGGPPRDEESLLADPELRPYARVLDRPTRDLDGPRGQGRLLPVDSVVLFHPLAPDEIMDASEPNQQKFKQQDFTWTVETRQKVWFPESGRFGSALRLEIDRARSRRTRFLDAIAQNLRSAVGTPFPWWRAPRWTNWLPYEWEPRIESQQRVADLSDELIEAVRQHAGVPAAVPWPTDWERWLREITGMVLHSLTRGSFVCHVVVVHVVPLSCGRGQEPVEAAMARGLLDDIRRIYQEWRSEKGIDPDTSVYFAIAFQGEPAEHLDVPSNDARAEVLVAFRKDGTWGVPRPRQEIARLSLRDFLDRLKPETREERLARIRAVVDEEAICYSGNVSENHIKERTGCRRSLVRDAFFHLQGVHPDRYRVVRLADGQLAIRERKKGEGISITAPSARRGALRRHFLGLLALAVGAVLTVGNIWLRQRLGLSIWVSTASGLVIAYLGQLAQKAINERAEKSRD